MMTSLLFLWLYIYYIEAVHRYYEGKRREFTDKKPERQEQVKRNKQATKHYLRKKQVCPLHCSNIAIATLFCNNYIDTIIQLYLMRSKELKDKETKYWDEVPVDAMSSETDGEDNGEKVMVRHSPSWRSESEYF